MSDEPINLSTANIAWQESGQPESKLFGDVYFSKVDGLSESRHVFLRGNNLEQRWLAQSSPAQFTVFETGFGTGLNFLSCWELWNVTSSEGSELHFISVEKYPLARDDLGRALALWPELGSLSEILLKNYPPQPAAGLYQIELQHPSIKNSARLTLVFAELATAFKLLGEKIGLPCSDVANFSFSETPNRIDAWFLDGFAPAKNPDMWTKKLYQNMRRLSQKNTTFATFTAAGHVRRGIEEVGFSSKKIKGFGRKREMLVGQLNSSGTEYVESVHNEDNKKRGRGERSSSWLYQKAGSRGSLKKHEPICIIGAGIAGSLVANRLAKLGYQVSVYEKNTIASGASSNLQGVVYSKQSVKKNPLNSFNLNAQLFADNFYQNGEYYKNCGSQCGVIHTAKNDRDLENYHDLMQRYAREPDFYQWVSTENSMAIAGVKLQRPGILMPQSGWLNPSRLCRKLLEHENIVVQENTEINNIERVDQSWKIHYNQSGYKRFNQVVLCCAYHAQKFTCTRFLPVRKIRGQVSHIISNNTLSDLKSVVCGNGYITPSMHYQGADLHSVGASFNLHSDQTDLDDKDHEHNVLNLKTTFDLPLGFSPELHSDYRGKVGFRTTSPDYFPIAGPIPNIAVMQTDFAALTKKANAEIHVPGAYLPGLYCCLAFGSRGLAYGPIAAELVTSIIQGHFLPVTEQIYQYLNPARFLIKSLIRHSQADV